MSALQPIFGAVVVAVVAPMVATSCGLRLSDRLGLERAYAGALGTVLFALAGYVEFWCAFCAVWLGSLFAVLVVGAALFVTVRDLRQNGRERDVIVPSLLVTATMLVFVGTLESRIDWKEPNATLSAAAELTFKLPIDNILPLLFADKLEQDADPRLLVGDWHSSDRPPLQVGAVLLARPFLDELAWEVYGYPLLAIFSQLTWILATWSLVRLIGFRPSHASLVLALPNATFFLFINTLFTWPKLLAAALFVVGVSLSLRVVHRPGPRDSALVVVALVSYALAYLSHSAIVFSLVPALFYLGATLGRRHAAALARGAILCLTLLVPWFAYAKEYDPPGDRLLKWHLAGVVGVSDTPFVTLLVRQYEKIGLAGALSNKAENVAALFAFPPGLLFPAVFDRAAAAAAASAQFYRFFATESFLVIGVVMLPFLARRKLADGAVRASLTLWALVAGSLAFWTAALYIPGSTVPHAGSYGTNVLLDVLLSAAIVRAGTALTVVLLAYGLASELALFAGLAKPLLLVPLGLAAGAWAWRLAAERT